MVDRAIISMYSRPQMGGDLPYFIGNQTQQGGGNWLHRIGRFAMPILRKFGLPIAKSVGRAAMKTVDDVISKKQSFKESIKNQAMNVLPEVKDNALNALKEVIDEQHGSGIRKRKRSQVASSINKRRRLAGTIFSK